MVSQPLEVLAHVVIRQSAARIEFRGVFVACERFRISRPRTQNIAQAFECGCEIGGQADGCPAAQGLGFFQQIGVADITEDLRKGDECDTVVRIDFECPAKFGGRLAFAVAGVMDVGEVDVGRRQAGLKTDGLAIRGLGLVTPSLIECDQSQAVLYLRECGIKRTCSPAGGRSPGLFGRAIAGPRQGSRGCVLTGVEWRVARTNMAAASLILPCWKQRFPKPSIATKAFGCDWSTW